VARVTSKGQITIPKDVREALGLRPGTEVDFRLERGGAVMRRRLSPEVFEKWEGYLRDKVGGPTTDDILLELRGEAE
jgi:AbrB family looped-hinge helix DNA binding protein